MIHSNNSARRGGNNSTVSSQDALPLPHCLPLDPITLGNQRCTRSGELRRALGVPIGSKLEANSSFGFGQLKPSTPLATEELRNFKESVQDTTKKARCRAKMLEKSITKLDEYREVIGTVKRQRTELPSSGRSDGGNSSMRGQNHRNPQDQRSEDNKTTGLGPKTRIRTSMLGARTDGRATRQQTVVKDRENRIKGSIDPQIDEKMNRLPVGGNAGWDRKMKRKRSVGVGGNNRSVNGSRDIKRPTLVTSTEDSKLRSVDAQGFRSNNPAGISGITVVESSMPANSSSRSPPRIELESIIDETIVGNGNIKSNIDSESLTGSPISVMDTKVSRKARTSSGDQHTNIGVSPAIGLENNQKRRISTTTSSSPAHHMAQLVGQRPSKISRTRRSNLAVPVSNANEEASLPISTKGFSASNHVAGIPYVKSEGEKHTNEEMKLNEKGVDADEVPAEADHKDCNVVLQPTKNKVLVNRGTGERIKNLPVAKPLQGSRRIPDKNRSKAGRRPSKNRKAPVRAGSVITFGSAVSAGESDDHEQLFAAAKYARNASNLACSSPFWKKMEYYFASITSRDALYIKDQLNVVEELNNNLSQMLDDEYNVLSAQLCKENSCQKPMKNGTPSLYQRLLSALIDDDENDYLRSEARNMSFQSASDDSHCGSCEPKVKDKVEYEVESGTMLQSHKHILDQSSCNKSASSNTNGSFSNNEQWQADDGLSNSSQVDGCVVSPFEHQYEMLSLDDRLLMELQSVGLSPVIMPHLEEGVELNQDINELQATRFQQVQKMTTHLGKIDKAIPDVRDAERRNMEEVAMDQLVEMAYKRRMAYRGSQSSKAVIRRVSKQAGLDFAKRTLDRCRKFEDTGTSCFSEPAIRDFLFSAAPPKSSNLFKSTNSVPSTTSACNMQSKRKEMLLDDVISNGKNGNITTANNNNDRSKKATSKENNKGNGAQTTTHPTGPFLRCSGQTLDNTSSQRREEDELVGFEDGLGLDLGGPQGDDLSSFLDFEEGGLQDQECVGLEIPMDDLTDLQMLM